ncbi:MAG: IS66 family transposase [Clostridiales bacterium]|nr:IS66 family transposase [Clostridiales bacterium]
MTLEEQLTAVLEENKQLRKEKDALLSRVAQLEQAMEWLRKKQFGRMSEKRLPLDPNQLSLFGEDEIGEEERAATDRDVGKSEETIAKTIKPKARPARKPIDDSRLPLEEIHVYPEGTTDEDGRLKDEYEELAPEVTKRLEIVPPKIYVVKTIRHKVILKSDGKKNPEERSILTPPLPLVPIRKCMAGASILTDIVVDKFMYHLPFYRIIQKYKEYGLVVSDSTIGGWFEETVEKLNSLHNLLKRKILASEYIQVDESVVPVIDNEKHRAKKGYMWVVRDGVTGGVVFHYVLGSRGVDAAREVIGNYQGILQCDGYEVYNKFANVKGITLLSCWAHARRKFTESLEENKELATTALLYIGKLYKVEAEADESGLTAGQRKDKRMSESYPVLRDFEAWLWDKVEVTSKTSRIGKAIRYTLGLMGRLSWYVNDGRVNIDNNLIENAIRPLAIGRKNFLFCGNDAAAYRAAIAYSLIGTCKAAGVDPRAWLEDVLNRIPYYEADGRDMTELLPFEWAESHRTHAE